MKRRESVLLLLLLWDSCAIYISRASHIKVALCVLSLELLQAGLAHAFLEDGVLFRGEVCGEVGDAETGGRVRGCGGAG
jgi:hypothetical protein